MRKLNLFFCATAVSAIVASVAAGKTAIAAEPSPAISTPYGYSRDSEQLQARD